MGTFKDLEVFQLAVNYSKAVYRKTERFPTEEKYGLTNQLRRGAISIISCIAEGSARRTAADQKHFIDVALGSLYETHAQLIMAEELGYLTEKKLGEAEDFIEKLKAKLLAYRKSIKGRTHKS